MEKVYDLHRHTHYVAIRIEEACILTSIASTSNRDFKSTSAKELQLGASIAYSKQRTDVTGFDLNDEEKDKSDIVITHFRDKLYELFKKDKETWDEEDYFLVKAVSDYLPLAVKKTMEYRELEIENFDSLHYAIVVPSEWEEEIRGKTIRPIFIQSGLISKEDHLDRLLFFTDIESLCYKHSFKRGDNTILCRVTPEEEEIIIRFDWIQTTTTLFNIPNAKLFPKVINSSSVSVTTDDVQHRIRDFLRTNLFSADTADNDSVRETLKPELVPPEQDQIIKVIMEELNSEWFSLMEDEYEEEIEEPWVFLEKEWELNESQKEFINSLCPSIICAEIGPFLFDYMNDIISNNFTKSYSLLLTRDYSSLVTKFENDISWLLRTIEYNSRFLNYVVDPVVKIFNSTIIMNGACEAVFEAIQNSDIHCKPRIVSSAKLTTSSSVFLNSKPDAIINLDISFGSTLFTCSLLNEDGSIRQIFDHGYFIRDKHLPPLKYFYTFSDRTTLNVRERFIPFAERYLLGDSGDLITDGVFITKDLLLEMKYILTNGLSDGEVLVSTDTQNNIEAFILMYMIYIKEEILYKFPDQLLSDQMDMRIGYAVSIEAILLNKAIESKDKLRDIIYASGLVQKDDNSKKLRITTQGEGILPAIQKSLKLELALKSYFLLCQLHEDYVQLSLHQVVTEPNPEEKYQESIIVQDEILSIQNIYDSLCLNMWCNLVQDSSLLELCEMHNTNDESKIIDLFSPKTKMEFFANLKGYISDNILQNNPDMRSTNTVNLTSYCKCKVHLTTSDIIDISFTPVLQDIACTLYASLLNKELFGNYMNIDYLFSIIHFSNNPQLRYAFARILEEEADDFNLELGIDTSCLVIPELFSQLLKPVISQQPLCYKDFKIGAFQQVCSESYFFSLRGSWMNEKFLFKSKITDTKTIECGYEVFFPLLNKGEIINNVRSNRKFYLASEESRYAIIIEVFSCKTMYHMESNETLSHGDNVYQSVGKPELSAIEKFGQKNVDIPVMVSVRYISYTSSFQFLMKTAGADITVVIESGVPLSLTRL